MLLYNLEVFKNNQAKAMSSKNSLVVFLLLFILGSASIVRANVKYDPCDLQPLINFSLSHAVEPRLDTITQMLERLSTPCPNNV